MLKKSKWRGFFSLLILLLLLESASKQADSSLELGIKQEETEKLLLVKGTFPLWLDGVLVRNSSIPIYQNGKQISHPFDGLAMLHGFDFRKGQVFYTNRFLLSKNYQAFQEGNVDNSGFAKRSSSSSANGVQNASVNVFKYGNSYVALTEVPLPARFDLKSLETLGSFRYQDSLPQSRIWESAHPHLDFASKEIINYFIEFGPQSHYVLYRIPEGSSSREVIAKLPINLPAYMHSFAMTERYLILTEFPLVIHPSELRQGKSFMQSMTWQPHQKTHFLVIEKSSGLLVAEGDTDPFFSFHHANAYDNGNEIILDLIAYPNISMMADIFSEATVSLDVSPIWKRRLMRYHFSLPNKQISSEVLLEKELEFPRLDDRLDGKKYRYLYLTLSEEREGGLVKFDHALREVKTWQQTGCKASEPIFVPAPHAQAEDEGVVLSIVLNEKENTSFLLALDGQSFMEIARATLPFHIPDSFHGQYFSESTFISKAKR
jgi:carotenoid cleavage dioxygenase-like enzyme